jgi:hypothetical protein
LCAFSQVNMSPEISSGVRRDLCGVSKLHTTRHAMFVATPIQGVEGYETFCIESAKVFIESRTRKTIHTWHGFCSNECSSVPFL